MDEVKPADANAHLCELADRTEAGARRPVDVAALRALTGALPSQSQSAEALILSMRESDRY